MYGRLHTSEVWQRYFVETGDYVSDIGKISGAVAWRPRPGLKKELPGPWIITAGIAKNTGKGILNLSFCLVLIVIIRDMET